MKKDVRFLLQ